MDWGKANACPLGGQDPFCAFSPEEELWLTLCWKEQLCCDFHHNPCIYPRTFTKESLNSFPKTSVTLTIMSLDHTVHMFCSFFPSLPTWPLVFFLSSFFNRPLHPLPGSSSIPEKLPGKQEKYGYTEFLSYPVTARTTRQSFPNISGVFQTP